MLSTRDFDSLRFCKVDTEKSTKTTLAYVVSL